MFYGSQHNLTASANQFGNAYGLLIQGSEVSSESGDFTVQAAANTGAACGIRSETDLNESVSKSSALTADRFSITAQCAWSEADAVLVANGANLSFSASESFEAQSSGLTSSTATTASAFTTESTEAKAAESTSSCSLNINTSFSRPYYLELSPKAPRFRALSFLST